MADIGVPNIDIFFRGLGASAAQKSKKGVAILIVSDSTDTTFTFKEYKSIADLTSEEEALYTVGNVQYIKDCLSGTPLKLIVARMDVDGTLADLLTVIKGKAPRNCWIGLADGKQEDQDALVSWVKAMVTNNKKRYKAMVKKATVSDDKHIHNLTNPSFTFKDERGKVTTEKVVSVFLGLFAGLPLNLSGIAKVLSMFESVEEPENLDEAVNKGELICFNDEGEVKVVRAVNSLITTGNGITDDMKFIMIVEKMDLTYTDIYETFDKFYKGKYTNDADYQALFIGAVNAYFEGLESSNIVDNKFDNKAYVNISAQRLINISKYGKDVVDSWDDEKAKEMTFSTNVLTSSNVKYTNAMEDMVMDIFM